MIMRVHNLFMHICVGDNWDSRIAWWLARKEQEQLEPLGQRELRIRRNLGQEMKVVIGRS